MSALNVDQVYQTAQETLANCPDDKLRGWLAQEVDLLAVEHGKATASVFLSMVWGVCAITGEAESAYDIKGVFANAIQICRDAGEDMEETMLELLEQVESVSQHGGWDKPEDSGYY